MLIINLLIIYFNDDTISKKNILEFVCNLPKKPMTLMYPHS